MGYSVNWQEIIKKYKYLGKKLHEPMIKKAINYAIKYHGTQKRASGDDYYHHPLEVAEIITRMSLDSASIITAILHDTIEDTGLTFDKIKNDFSPEIAKLVDGVTKLTKIEYKPQNIRQAENFRKFLLAISDDIRVLLVKLADRLHNMRTIHFLFKAEKKRRIALETMEIYAPLAERIGAQQIKVELQDICFEILHKETRQSILNRFVAIESSTSDSVNQIVKELENKVCKAGYKVEIYGRRKTPYSTWMKMKQKDVGIDQLSDIIAFRVITYNKKDCYAVLGIMHAHYKMVPGNFQDFISTPKPNGYQSIHTVVIGPLKHKIEIQIRTQAMHDVAEFGVAAHWQYKQGEDDQSEGVKYAWIRELLSILEKDKYVMEEFLYNTKLAMYYNQVFCFTPDGHLIALPKGATIIDFAYTVHSDIGNSCIGAKINGLIVPLKTQLSNGDQVEIITDKNQTASPSWEQFVITGKARSEIRKTIRIQQHSQYIKLGNNIIKKMFTAENIENEADALKKACEILNITEENLLFKVGNGTITKKEILQCIKPQRNTLTSRLSLFKFLQKKNTEKKNLVPIKGLISGMAIHYAKCCYPLPGDRITGIIHTGIGTEIHTFDCKKLDEFSKTPERIIELTWDENKENIPFVSRINIVLLDLTLGLKNIINEIIQNNCKITNFKIITRNRNYFEINIDIKISSANHIDKIINALRANKLIQRIERSKCFNK